MKAARGAAISRSLEPLRDVVESLSEARDGAVPEGAERQRLLRRVRRAGGAALPTLLRGLASTHEPEATLAYYLLSHIGDDRLIGRLASLLESAETPDRVKARALGLLSDLKVPAPTGVRLNDPEKLLAESVNQLLETLEEPGELAEAVDLILEQVPEPEMAAFANELVKHGGAKARRLIQALLKRDDLMSDTLSALRKLDRREQRTRVARTAQSALERGLEYLEAGRPRAARRRLERVTQSQPRLAEGRSALGICLLQLGDCDGAFGELREAAALQPHEALHQWNLAACAKQAERVGGAYLALREYLALKDETEGAEERRAEARGFVRSYEKMLQGNHPDVSLIDYLRGEELFARAYAALAEGRPEDAVRGFQSVIDLVPRHYPSWGNLGTAYAAIGRKRDAVRCFEQALELNPKYSAALKNLAELQNR